MRIILGFKFQINCVRYSNRIITQVFLCVEERRLFIMNIHVIGLDLMRCSMLMVNAFGVGVNLQLNLT